MFMVLSLLLQEKKTLLFLEPENRIKVSRITHYGYDHSGHAVMCKVWIARSCAWVSLVLCGRGHLASHLRPHLVLGILHFSAVNKQSLGSINTEFL